MPTHSESSPPRGRRIPLSRFWLDWRISFFLVAACIVIVGSALIALWGRPAAVSPAADMSAAMHRERAEVYEGLGKTGEAIRAYQGAIRLTPGDASLHRALASLLEKDGRFAEAIVAYERFLALVPDSRERAAVRARIEMLRQRR